MLNLMVFLISFLVMIPVSAQFLTMDEVYRDLEDPNSTFEYDYAARDKPLKAKKVNPRRTISVIVNDDGFYPKNISIFKDEMVTFFVTGTGTIPHCFMLDDFKLFLSANRGRVNEGSVQFTKSGKFIFHCPTLGKRLDPRQGTITVLKRRVKKKKRQPASVLSMKKNWKPRAFPKITEQVMQEY